MIRNRLSLNFISWLTFLLLFTSLTGCTTLDGKIHKISENKLKDHAIVAGRLSVYSVKNNRSMQDYFGPKFITYATRSEPKKVYELLVPSKDNGYFAWDMEPGSYFFHHTQIREGGNEMKIADFDSLSLKAGEVVYIGDIHIEIGGRKAVNTKDQLGQLVKRPIDAVIQGAEVPIYASQRVSDNSYEMKEYLVKSSNLKSKLFRTKLTQSWTT